MIISALKGFLIVCASMAILSGSGAMAAETVTYTYDAKGRLTKVTLSGGPNHGAKTEYEHDKASNRKRVKTSGAFQ